MRAVLRSTLAARRSARPTAAENSLVSFFTLVAHRVIEWVKYGKNGALIGSTPPLEKGGIGGIFRCCHTIADLRPKLAPCGQSRPTPSYTCGTACGENKSSVCSSIGKNPSPTTSLIFMHRWQNSSSNSMALSIWSTANQNMTHNGPGIWSSKD